MLQQQLCQNCSQKHNCRAVYERLGSTNAPSVLREVLAAFVSPILLFITTLAVSQRLLTGIIVLKQWRTAVSFVTASAAVFLFVSVLRTINKRTAKN